MSLSSLHEHLWLRFRAIHQRLVRRARWARLGVYHPAQPIRSIRVDGNRIALSLPETETERNAQDWEIRSILFDDCYRLAAVKKPVQNILDIGGNIGLFTLAAHRHFPKATIHCYEPNQTVLPHLRSNCATFDVQIHEAAVGESEGFVCLDVSDSSVQAISKIDATGTIRMESFSTIVKELGYVDLVKLDCEGAEWEIFRCMDAWQNIRTVVMEYHLWARPGSTIEDLRRELRAAGFLNIEIVPSPDGPWGFACANR
jgi:FkbM family methyltransferase